MNSGQPLAIYLEILERAAQRQLPERIEAANDIYHPVRELVEEGYLSAIFANTKVGPSVLHAAITLLGRQYLADQQNALAGSGWRETWRRCRPVAGWLVGIVVMLLVAWLLTYGIGA